MNQQNLAGINRAILILKIVVVLLLALALAYGSVYTIGEQEQAVIVTLGKPVLVSASGLHFKIPFVQEKHIISMTVKSFSIGYDNATDQSIEAESLMITSDYNFVNVDFFVEFKVSDPIQYKYASKRPEDIFRMMAVSYIRDTVGRYPVDSVITDGKSEIQAQIKEKLIKRLDEENIGLQLINITIRNATPPTAQVLEAFKAVETAKQGKETAINNANKYRSEQEPAAIAQADAIQKQADAQKESRINEAKGQAARFDAIYEEYQKNPLITKQRMYYEAMEDILPELKVIIDDAGGDTSKMLPLESFAEQKGAE